MYEALISACETLDEFGLPRAVGRFDADRLIFANRSFLDAIGFEKDEAAGLALSAIVKIHLDSPEAAKVGRLVPITVRSPIKHTTISGHATFGEDGLVFLMLVLPSEPSAELEAAQALKREQERQQIANYIHEHIAPELMSVVFSIESIRLELEDQKPTGCREIQRARCPVN
jgi:signal transduction histidine kinase